MSTLDVTKHTNFTTALTAIGTARTELIISSDTAVTTNVVVPSNLSVKIEGAGQFTASGATHSINFNGPFSGPDRKLFYGFGANEILFDTAAQPIVTKSAWLGTVGPAFRLSSGKSHGTAYIHTRLMIEDDTFAYLQFSTPGNLGEASGILFGDAASNIAGILDYDHATDNMFFFTNSLQRMRLTENGLFLFDPGIPIAGAAGFPGDNIDPDTTLHVYQGDSGGASFPTAIMTLEDDTSVLLQFLTPNTSYAGLCIGDPQSANAATFYYDNSVDRWLCYVGNTERLRVDNTHGLRAPDIRVYNGNSHGTKFSASNMVIEDDTTTFLQFLTPNNAYSGLIFGDPQNNISGGFYYSHSLDQMFLDTQGTTRFNVSSVGKVGIGMTTTVADSFLHVYGGSAGVVTAHANAILTIEHSAMGLLQFLTPNSAISGFLCGDPEAVDAGGFYYNHVDDSMAFTTNQVERLRLDNNKNISLGGFGTAFGASSGGVGIPIVTTAPAGNVPTGALIYFDGTTLKYKYKTTVRSISFT